MKPSRYALYFIAATAAFLLGGCASMRQMSNEVSTQSSLKSLPVAGYRFERLPSQQAPDQVQNQTALEAMAEKALALVGMRRDEAKPGYSVQIAARVQRDLRSAWDDPGYYGASPYNVAVAYGRGGGRAGFGYRGGIYWGPGYWGPGYPRYDRPYLRREVSVLMRDLSTGLVVYETQAVNDSLWADNQDILPLMFQAAVSGFPTPPNGRRLVNIDVTAPVPAQGPGPAPAAPATAKPVSMAPAAPASARPLNAMPPGTLPMI